MAQLTFLVRGISHNLLYPRLDDTPRISHDDGTEDERYGL